jgi:hypothetical protein
LAHGVRMLRGAQYWSVSIVMQLDQFWSPSDEHGKARVQANAHSCTQALRPALYWLNGRCRPIDATHVGTHLASAGKTSASERGDGRTLGSSGVHIGLTSTCH